MSGSLPSFSPARLLALTACSGAAHHEFRDGRWTATPWREFVSEALRLARALVTLPGMERGARICLLGAGSRWVTAYLAAQLAGLVPVGIYHTSPFEETCFIVRDCGARLLFADRQALAAGVSEEIKIPVVFFDDAPAAVPAASAGTWLSWSQLMEKHSQVDEQIVLERVAMQSENDVASLIYTSGTTGLSKGVVLTFSNINAFLRARVCAVHGPHTRALSFMPLSHLAGQGWTIWVMVCFGGQVWFGRGLPFLAEDLLECRPTTFFAPPRVYAGWFREFSERDSSFNFRRHMGLEACDDVICAAAPVDERTLAWFQSNGVFLREVYGLSEVPVATSSALIEYKPRSVGKAENQVTFLSLFLFFCLLLCSYRFLLCRRRLRLWKMRF